MADVQVLEATGSANGTSTTWVDVATIPAASFTAGAKYLILAFAMFQSSSSANEGRLRLVRGTTPTEFTDAYNAEELLANTTHSQAGWMTMYTQPGTTELVKIQISSSAASTTTGEWGHIIAINLDDIGTEDTDYRYNEVTADLTLSTSYQDGATETWTPNGTDKWLMIGQVSWVPGDVAAQTDVQIVLDGTSVGLVSEEGEDVTNERRNRLIMWAATPTNASHTFKVQAKGETATGTVQSSRVFVLNLSKFAQADYNVSSGTTALVEGAGWTNIATLSPTPGATGNFVILSSQIQDYNAATGTSPQGRQQVNASGGGLASAPAYGDDGLGVDTWDGTDQRSLFLGDVLSLSSGASRQINVDAQMSNTGVADPQIFHRALVYFSVLKASSGTLYTPATMNGGLSFSGAFSKRDNKALTGGLSFSGAFSKRGNKALTGGLSFVGAFTKRTNKPFTGGLTFSGALGATRTVLKALTGGLSFVGSLVKQTNKPFVGGITPTGAFSKRTNKAFAGSITPSGVLSAARTFVKALTGGLSFAGSLVKRTNKPFAGGITPTGAFSKRTNKAFTAGLTFSGAFSKRARKSFTGGLSFTGSLAKRTSKALAGGLSFTGSLVKRTNRAFTAALSFVGSFEGHLVVLGETYFKAFTAGLTFSGSLMGTLFRDRGQALSDLLLRQMFGGVKGWRSSYKPLKRDK
jgi:hypothetical protein